MGGGGGNSFSVVWWGNVLSIKGGAREGLVVGLLITYSVRWGMEKELYVGGILG